MYRGPIYRASVLCVRVSWVHVSVDKKLNAPSQRAKECHKIQLTLQFGMVMSDPREIPFEDVRIKAI